MIGVRQFSVSTYRGIVSFKTDSASCYNFWLNASFF
jgi:hypothetical protein